MSFWIIMLGFVVLLTWPWPLGYTCCLRRRQPRLKKKKDKKPATVPDPVTIDTSKDWKAIAERWEKHKSSVCSVRSKKMKMDQKRAQQLTDERKSEVKDLVEKLALEKSWREKEQETLEKFKHHEKDLKDQIIRTEGDLEKEHSNRLRLERELQDIKIKYDQTLEEKRALSIKTSSLQTTVDANSKELRELKSENARLQEKREDIQWVAKTEFDQFKKAFAAQEQELTRLKQKPLSQ